MVIHVAFAAAIALSSIAGATSVSRENNTYALARINAAGHPESYYVTCFLKSERISGMNKLCFYDCLGSETAITLKNTDLCPLTIER